MPVRVVVEHNTYRDSAFLMAISRKLEQMSGIEEAVVLMATPMNQDLLTDAGFEVPQAGPLDMVIALRGETLDDAAAELERLLKGGSEAAERGEVRHGSLGEALDAQPSANLVSIAIPGPFAARLTRQALDAGKHVFLFSDNVAVEDEVALKEQGLREGLLVMGPDCGTSIIAGTGLGFANQVQRGRMGLAGPSGTGIQELCCLLDAAGEGISQAIGTGGRDLSAAVGGAMTRFAAHLLGEDPDTEVVVLVGKKPDPGVAEAVHQELAALSKPAVVRWLGLSAPKSRDGVYYAQTLEEAAAAALALTRGESPPPPLTLPQGPLSGRLVGLFGGGSLASEAQLILERCGLELNHPDEALSAHRPLPPGCLVVDIGDDDYTRGRPHPMVDQTVRLELMGLAGRDPTVHVLLLDVVLCHGAHPDPASELAPLVAELLSVRSDLEIVVSVSGTRADPQGTQTQRQRLAEAGARVFPSAGVAAIHAAQLLSGRSA